MPSIAVTDLDNLPPGTSLGGELWVRTGNTIYNNANVRSRIEYEISFSASQGAFQNGDIFELAFKLNSLNRNFIRVYARAVNQQYPTSLTAGHANWVYAPTDAGEFYPGTGVGSDSTSAFRVPPSSAGQTLVFKVALTNLDETFICGGVRFYVGIVGNDWANTSATFSTDFMYLYGNYTPSTDPYDNLNVPPSEPGGGPDSPSGPIGYDGITHDPIDFPELQTFSVSDAGFVSIWCPTLDQLKDLSFFLWNADPLTVEFWKRIVSSPLEMILGLMILPYSIPEADLHEDGDVYLGYKKSGIKMNYTTKQFVSVDCGSIDIKEVWGAFLDYSPYTKISIYLPYIGVHDLDTDEVMNKVISLKYYIDLCTGSCVAVLKCGDTCLYTFNGNCAVQIPITTAQHADALKALLSIAGSSLQMAAVGGVAGAAAGAAIGGLTQLENIKPKVSHSGSLSATNGYMASQTPYLIFSRPKQAQPEEQQKYTGYPSFITSLIGDLEGYSEIEVIHLHNMTCTEEELNEIDSLLSEGVII